MLRGKKTLISNKCNKRILSHSLCHVPMGERRTDVTALLSRPALHGRVFPVLNFPVESYVCWPIFFLNKSSGFTDGKVFLFFFLGHIDLLRSFSSPGTAASLSSGECWLTLTHADRYLIWAGIRWTPYLQAPYSSGRSQYPGLGDKLI